MIQLKTCISVAGLILVGIALIPYRSVATKTFDDGAVESALRFTFGIPASPFILIIDSETKPGPGILRPDGGTTYKTGPSMRKSSEVKFISWSTLSLVMGLLILNREHWPRRVCNPRLKPLAPADRDLE